MTDIRNAALAWHAAGYSVLPIRRDGSKRPACDSWQQYIEQAADRATVEAWFTDDRHGLGVVMGAASGNAEMVELEGRAINRITDLGDLAEASGLGPLWKRLLEGYSEQTPSGGLHLIFRCPEIVTPGNMRLAVGANKQVLAETRGQGGQVVVAPTPGAFHETGKPWRLWFGGPTTVPVLTADERDAIYTLFRTLDETPEPAEEPKSRVARLSDGASPGDAFEAATDWRDILGPHGWTRVPKRPKSKERYWCRPGKRIGVSATTGRDPARDRLYVFTSSTEFEPDTCYTKFAAYALLEHGGDYSAAAKALRARGFGAPPKPVVAPDPLPSVSVTAMVDGATAKVVDLDEKREPEHQRRIELTPASAIKPKRVKWLWAGRLAVGSISLLAGREGLGKSTMAYWTAARITRGELPGEHQGTPKSVLVCATEDSWEHTIVPRLMAAGADLDRVYRVDVVSAEEIQVGLSLPRDVHRVEVVAREVDAVLLLLDPLMSRIDASLDTHRDGEVRLALEPLAALADRAGMVVFGLIHLNKGSSSDILTAVMGSRAFAAVARSVCAVVRDPDDEEGRKRLFGTPKNNLGPDNLPLMSFTVESHPVETDDGTTFTGRIEWHGEVDGSIDDALSRASEDPETRTVVQDAVDWLAGYLEANGGEAESRSVKDEARRLHIHESTLTRARKRLRIKVSSIKGYSPPRTLWSLPVTNVTKRDFNSVTALGERK